MKCLIEVIQHFLRFIDLAEPLVQVLLYLAVYNEPDLFQPRGFTRLDELTKRLAQIPDVRTTTSLATTPLGSGIIHTNINPAAEKLVELMEGYTVGTDRETAAVICILNENHRIKMMGEDTQEKR